MHAFLKIQSQIVPEMLDIMQKRYQILRSIRLTEPVGRRTLAEMLGMTERILRSEAELLKSLKLIEIKTAGMMITPNGKRLLLELDEMMREICGIQQLERRLKEILGIAKIVIVPGDSDETPLVKEEIGKACADMLNSCIDGDNIIAVTGGTTMACTAEMLSYGTGEGRKLLFVPARGGIGEDVKNQANVICATMAEKTGGIHRVLYVPDQVGREVYMSLQKEPAILEVLKDIKSASIILHGIGEALTMAGRRRTSEVAMKIIMEEKAVGEAFGFYFNENGEIVHKVPTIGMQMSDLHDAKYVIAAAGGEVKG